MVRQFLGNIKGEKGEPGERGLPGEITQQQLTSKLEQFNGNIISQREVYSTNAADFGVVGDGVTDDTLALQSAIDHANTKSRMLYIPKGKYLITESLVLNGCSVYGPKGNVYEKNNYQGAVIVCATQDFIAIKQGSLKMPDIQFTMSDIMVENALIGFEINYVINSVFTNLYVRLSDTGFKMGDPTAVGSMFNHFNNFYTVDCRVGIESHSRGYFNNNTFNNGFIAGDEYAIKINVDGGYGAVNNTFNNVEIKSTLGRGVILESNSNTNFNNCYFEVGGNAIRTLNFCVYNLVDCVYGVFKAENTNGDTSVVFAETGVYIKVDGGVIFLNEGNTNGLFYDSNLDATHQNIYQLKEIRKSQTSSAPGFQMYASEINQVVYNRDVKDFVKKQELDGYVSVTAKPFDIENTTSASPTPIENFDVEKNTEQISADGKFSLSPGYWIIDISTRPSEHDIDGGYALALYYMGGLIRRETKDIRSGKTLGLSTTLNIQPGDTFYFGFSMYGVSTEDFNAHKFTLRNEIGNNIITMKKIGGI